jgi:hypothetical protein
MTGKNAEDFGGYEAIDDSLSLTDLASLMANGQVATGDTAKPAGAPTAGNNATSPPNQPQGTDADHLPILAADGKNFIPNTVLKNERQARQDAERKAQQLEIELAQLRQTATPGGQGQPGQTQPGAAGGLSNQELAGMTEAEIADLEADFPEVAKLARTMQAQLLDLQTRTRTMAQHVDPIVQQSEQQRQTAQQAEEAAIAEAIDQVPVLRYLQDTQQQNPALWNEIVTAEAALRNLPKFRNEPLASVKVFEAAVAEIEAVHGKIQLPPEYQSHDALRQKAEQAVKQTGQFVPRTLSDLQGGVSPESDVLRVENMSLSELFGVMQNLPEKDQNAIIARYA